MLSQLIYWHSVSHMKNNHRPQQFITLFFAFFQAGSHICNLWCTFKGSQWCMTMVSNTNNWRRSFKLVRTDGNLFFNPLNSTLPHELTVFFFPVLQFTNHQCFFSSYQKKKKHFKWKKKMFWSSEHFKKSLSFLCIFFNQTLKRFL